MTVALLSSVGMAASTVAATAVAQDDLLQDAGSWAQVVGEGSLKVVDPSLEKGRIWLEGQSRWDDNWNHWYQGMARARRLFVKRPCHYLGRLHLATYRKCWQTFLVAARCLAGIPLYHADQYRNSQLQNHDRK